MKLNTFYLKVILGITYLALISIGLYFLFSFIDVKDLTSYEFIRANKDIILQYKTEHFLFLAFVFFAVSAVWILLLGFATPLLLFAGFAFGKWWGIVIVSTATTVGAALLYLLVGFFFRDTVEEKLAPKFSKLRKFFNKNDIFYFTCYRFIGGGGTPFAIQNIVPILFNMPLKNYVTATFFGCIPSMFVTVALGSGIENIIESNEELSVYTVLSSPDIYLPIFAFCVILAFAFILKKIYFK